MLLRTHRNLYRARSCAKYVMNLANYVKEVGAGTVHLIHVADTRNVIFVRLTPYCFRLRLYTTNCTKCHHGTIQDAERTLYFNSKVYVTRSVYEIDFVFLTQEIPIGRSSSRSDSNTTFLLLLHPVHCCSTVMNLTNFVSQSGIEQNTLRGCSLTGINVSHDTDVSVIFQVVFSHFLLKNGSVQMHG